MLSRAARSLESRAGAHQHLEQVSAFDVGHRSEQEVDLLEDRYQRGVVIVTSQVDHRGWFKLFEDPVVAEAIVDRLVNPSQRVVLKGGSYRERLGPNKHSA